MTFSQNPLLPDFELLDSECPYYYLPISKKIHRDTFFVSQSMLLPLVAQESFGPFPLNIPKLLKFHLLSKFHIQKMFQNMFVFCGLTCLLYLILFLNWLSCVFFCFLLSFLFSFMFFVFSYVFAFSHVMFSYELSFKLLQQLITDQSSDKTLSPNHT